MRPIPGAIYKAIQKQSARSQQTMASSAFNNNLMYQSNQSLNILPPGIPPAFDVFSYPGGREFDELSLPGVGHLITAHGGGEFDH